MYQEAIMAFRKALQVDPASMNIQCNLADSLRCSQQVVLAASDYERVLSICPHYLDALVGLGECNKTFGDEAAEADNESKATYYFQEAKKLFQKAAGLMNTEQTSRRLTPQEESALYYSSGYTKVRLYELNKGRNLLLLYSARSDLKKVKPFSPEHHSAVQAIREIRQRILSLPAIRKQGAFLIFLLSLFLFLVPQWMLLKSYLSKPEKVLTLKSLALREAGHRAGNDSTRLVQAVTSLLLEDFVNMKELRDSLVAAVPSSLLPYLNMETLVQSNTPPATEMDHLKYGTLTFGGLAFMIIGLFLPQINRQKVGSIEMEKKAVDTVRTTEMLIMKKG